MVDENAVEGGEESPNFLGRYKKTTLNRLPTMEELNRAATAPHDADVEFLRYLSLRPEIVGPMENMMELAQADQEPGSYRPEPKRLMERIREELEKRNRQGEKGGELLL